MSEAAESVVDWTLVVVIRLIDCVAADNGVAADNVVVVVVIVADVVSETDEVAIAEVATGVVVSNAESVDVVGEVVADVVVSGAQVWQHFSLESWE